MLSLWNRFLGRNTKRGRLDMLPQDILIDEILSRLSLRDILRVRRVNKTFFALTKRDALWKRFLPYLPALQYPLPTLPPTSKYDIRSIPPVEIERLVTRAISLDNNWRSGRPKILRELHCLTYDEVLGMALLPGGHYMVASVRDITNRYSIVVWVMDHPANNRPVPIIFRQTTTKAYHLQAKYMTVQGRKSICIAFLRKRHKDGNDNRPIPETAEMGGPIDEEDPHMPIKYECLTLTVSLEALERLSDSHIHPGTLAFEKVAMEVEKEDPIRVVSRIRSASQLGVVSLDEVFGAPHVFVMKRPDRIVFEHLNTNSRTTMTCGPGPIRGRYCIWNFRPLPDQRQILVFRYLRVKDERLPAFLVPNAREQNIYHLYLYDLPETSGNHRVQHHSVIELPTDERKVVNVQIVASDHNKTLHDNSIYPLFKGTHQSPTISIYIRFDDGLDQFILYPTALPMPPTPPPSPNEQTASGKGRQSNTKLIYRFSLETEEDIGTIVIYKQGGFRELGVFSLIGEDHRIGNYALRVVPGAYRALMYSVPPDDLSISPSVMDLHTFVSPVADPDNNVFISHHATDANGTALPQQFVRSWKESNFPCLVEKEKESQRVIWTGRRKGVRWPNNYLNPVKVQEGFADVLRKGVSAIAWDEDAGRACITTKKDKQLHILDFSSARKEDDFDRTLYDEADQITKMFVDRE